MSMHEAARLLAGAIRGHTHARTERARQASSAAVVSLQPLELDLHGSDLTLDDDDVTIDADLLSQLQVGDLLTVVEVAEGDWTVVARHA